MKPEIQRKQINIKELVVSKLNNPTYLVFLKKIENDFEKIDGQAH